jgi:ADP-dependent NAD(P)H-hydrate dehydratase / NAD(P)H-hydrate epimerase
MKRMILEKVVTSSEMRRIEKIAISEGEKEEDFVFSAGRGIADKLSEFPSLKKLKLLAGKGNNAADGFVAATFLLKKGFEVEALLFFTPVNFSPICLKSFEGYKTAGGKYREITSFSDIDFAKDEIIIDAIFGTGFKGKVESPLSDYIEKINSYKNLTIAIDIPSGVVGDSGEVFSSAIKADHTLYLELPKKGFFLGSGWEKVGEIHRISFGLKKKYIDLAEATFFLALEESLADLPKIERVRNKYSAGFVVAIAGSPGMEGAANLSGRAALRAGAGIVKLFILGFRGESKEPITDELVKLNLDPLKKKEILDFCNSASSLFIGPGIGRTKEINDLLTFLLPKLKKPLVLDADGLYFLANNLSCLLPQETVLTPHRREMERLIGKSGVPLGELIKETEQFCQKYRVVIVLKGAPTFILSGGEKPVIIIEGDPGMATAGSGDVLTGVVAALIAEGLDIYQASILGAIIHGKAGKAAARDKSSYSMIASDIIDHLPEVFKKILMR